MLNVMLSVTNKPFILSAFMLNVIMLGVVMLNVVAPIRLVPHLPPRHGLLRRIHFRGLFEISEALQHLVGLRGHVEGCHRVHPAKAELGPML